MRLSLTIEYQARQFLAGIKNRSQIIIATVPRLAAVNSGRGRCSAWVKGIRNGRDSNRCGDSQAGGELPRHRCC